MSMKCPICNTKTYVSQTMADIRVRQCPKCSYEGTTEETWRNPPKSKAAKPEKPKTPYELYEEGCRALGRVPYDEKSWNVLGNPEPSPP